MYSVQIALDFPKQFEHHGESTEIDTITALSIII